MKAKPKTPAIETWPIEKVKPYELNPRKRTMRGITVIADSIREFGFKQPIVVDKKGVIIAGHGRHLAAQELGLLEVPVLVAKDLSPDQVKAYRIADNRTAEESDWDMNLLPLQLGDLERGGLELSLTGFTPIELGRLLGDEDGRADEAPPTPKKPVSKMGDRWKLGDHRLLCGDATNEADVKRAMNKALPLLMVTDPPYGVGYDADWRNRANLEPGKQSIGTFVGRTKAGTIEQDGNADWREAWAHFQGDVVYVWHAGTKADVVAEGLAAVGFKIRSQIIWVKQHFAISRGHYHVKHEPCWYAVREGKAGRWAGGRKQSTVWEVANRAAFGGQTDDASTEHSAQKPVDVMQRPIQNHGAPGDFVYDPFVGVGTTIIAAERAERRCLAIDIDPGYIDVAVERWQNYTGGKAKCEHAS